MFHKVHWLIPSVDIIYFVYVRTVYLKLEIVPHNGNCSSILLNNLEGKPGGGVMFKGSNPLEDCIKIELINRIDLNYKTRSASSILFYINISEGNIF